jgi:Ran GTPase-activating protein (RanGAP) involved in mRNA processing and transport
MLGIIDRFEENFAVIELENKEMVNLEKRRLPRDAKEGDVLNIEEEITINYKETEIRKKEVEELTENLFEE